MFNDHDLKFYKMFKHIVGQAKIEIEGKAVQTASLAFQWFDDLEKRIENDLQSKNKKEEK